MKIIKNTFWLIIIVECFIILLLIYHLFPRNDFSCYDCNILLITMDALRPDHMGIYGYYRNTTPNIDKLAKNGLVFSDYFANGPNTFISLPSLISSKYPVLKKEISFKYDDLGEIFYYDLVDNKEVTLPQLLSRGHNTIALFNNDMRHTNMFKDFQVQKIYNFIPDTNITEEALKILENQNSKFFIWIHYTSPHTPYRPPYPFNETFYMDQYYDKSNKIDVTKIPFYVNSIRARDPSNVHHEEDIYLFTDEFDYYISQYDGEIRFIDNEIKKLLDKFDELELSDNTLIIISSDHGEYLGEHEFYFKHEHLYDEVLKIPLIIYNPKYPKNLKFDEQIQGIDLFPTILDIVNVKKPGNIDGESFYGLITGKNYQERIAYSVGWENLFSLRSRKWKFIQHNDDKMLFDLEKDPKEQTNIINQTKLPSKFAEILDITE